MKQQPFSRRSLLQGTLAGGLAAAPYVYSRGAAPTPEALTGKSLREPIRSRVMAGRGTILAELKPTPEQLEHGLQLHHDAYVADLMGAVYVAAAIGQPGPRLQHMLAWNRKELEAEGVDPREASRLVRRTWWNHKPLESAFENGWQEDWRALYQLTGLDLAVEDNAGHYTFDQCLRWMATSNLAYGRLPDVVRIAGAKDLRKARTRGSWDSSPNSRASTPSGCPESRWSISTSSTAWECAWPSSPTPTPTPSAGTPTSSGTATRGSPGRAANWCAG